MGCLDYIFFKLLIANKRKSSSYLTTGHGNNWRVIFLHPQFLNFRNVIIMLLSNVQMKGSLESCILWKKLYLTVCLSCISLNANYLLCC